MKNSLKHKSYIFFLLAAFSLFSCKKNHNAAQQFNVAQTDLVADSAGFGASRTDPTLLNAWGIAANPNGIIWIASNHGGVSEVYDSTGKALIPPVWIPSITPGQPGAPSGIVYNSTPDFAGGKFIFASEDGIIAAWKSGGAAAIVADRSAANAVYKGLAIASDGGANFVYVANFKGAKIDVFDANFNYVTTKPFSDPGIPAGYGPFNVRNIGNLLYVTYAKLKAPDDMDDQAGPGNGYVDVFKPDGTLISRFASQGTLNSPWGIALAPAGFAWDTPTILIGNFGDGKINIFDMTGNYKGQLQNNGQALSIDGLWAIDFLKNNPGSSDALYFTAGPSKENHGLFGYLKRVITVSPQAVSNY